MRELLHFGQISVSAHWHLKILVNSFLNDWWSWKGPFNGFFSNRLQILADFTHQWRYRLQSVTLPHPSGGWLMQQFTSITTAAFYFRSPRIQIAFSPPVVLWAVRSDLSCRIEMHWLTVGTIMIPDIAFCSVYLLGVSAHMRTRRNSVADWSTVGHVRLFITSLFHRLAVAKNGIPWCNPW